jgi:transposase-like protein
MPLELKKQALHLYLEGLGFRSIGRILKVSNVAVLKWIKKFGEEVKNIHNQSNVNVIELDELYTYIGSKKTSVGYGLLSIGSDTNTSNLYLETDQLQQVKNSGRR